jgi:membrane protein
MMRRLWHLLRDTAQAFHDDGAMQLAAAVAFYAALSLGPLLIITLRVVGRVWGAEAVRNQIIQQIHSVMEGSSARTLEAVLKNADEGAGWNFAAVVGIITLAFSAMAVFSQLQDAMNKVCRAAPDHTRVWGFIKKRLLTLAMLAIIAAVVLGSLLFSWVINGITSLAPDYLPAMSGILKLTNIGINLAIFTVVFASIFKILPDADVAWRDVWLGAVVTTILFAAGKEVIAMLLGRNAVAGLYGAAGSMVLLLLWVYYSSVILFVGAEFTCVWSRRDKQPGCPKETEATRRLIRQDTPPGRS